MQALTKKWLGPRRAVEVTEPTAASRAEALLAEFEASGKGWFWETNRDGLLTYISDSVGQVLNRESADLINCPFTDLMTPPTRSAAAASERTLGFYLSSHVAFQDLIVEAKSKEEVWWSVSGAPIHDEAGRFFGFRGFAADLTEKRRSEVELDRLARFDSLTGLANRAMLRRALDDALVGAARRKQRCAIFLLDLDRFKAVNDSLGHPAGDTLLKLVALRLTETIGDRGQVGRLGGDEFEVVLPTTADRAELSQLAQAVIDYLSRPYFIDGNNVSIGASVGIVTSDYDDRTADDLIRDADLALYAAKAAGRGVFCFFETKMNEEAKDRQIFENELRDAVEKERLHVVFQPSVDVNSEETTGFEALVRWNHPQLGPVSPAQFIPLAEEIGLIDQIGEFVLRTACREATRWPRTVSIAVNLSPLQFKLRSLPATVKAILSETGLEARRLELEITEGVLLSNDAQVHDMIASLKGIGIKLALDDFGTGFSSLSYLRTVPFDKIKIDQSFVRGASDETSRSAALIRAMVGLAADLKMQTTAEGVETQDELVLVKRLGCGLVQGYLYGKPMPSEEALEFVNRTKTVTSEPLQPREQRFKLIRGAIVHHERGSIAARLRNISRGGALLECHQEFAVGTTLTLDISAESLLDATVVWTSGKSVGVQFAKPFDLKKLGPATNRTSPPLAVG
nr:EAL domain-containing protein [uncultured Sphingomonas sp.]